MTSPPPPEFETLQSRPDELLSGYRAGVEHFSEDSTDGAPVVRGWGTRMWTVESDAPPLWLWFDALDNDVALAIGDFGWFEWRELSSSTWQDEVASIVAAVLAGRVTKKSSLWNTSCEVVLEDGAVRRTSSGRPVQLRRPDPCSLLPCRRPTGSVQLPPYPSRA